MVQAVRDHFHQCSSDGAVANRRLEQRGRLVWESVAVDTAVYQEVVVTVFLVVVVLVDKQEVAQDNVMVVQIQAVDSLMFPQRLQR
jgi:hypothetical protein